MQCIYCKNTIDDSNGSVEHVFLRSFGCPDAWTIEIVCVESVTMSWDAPLRGD